MRILAMLGVLAMGTVGLGADGLSADGGQPALVATANSSGYELGLAGADPFYSTDRPFTSLRAGCGRTGEAAAPGAPVPCEPTTTGNKMLRGTPDWFSWRSSRRP